MTTEALLERITIDPEICHGKPCIRHRRYPVEVILELLSSGMTTEEILADYEDLEREDILAALAFAARLSQVKSVDALTVPQQSRQSSALRSVTMFLLAFSVWFPQLSFGAEARLFMAGTEMRLGMPEESLVAKLKEDYKLTNAGEHGWAIFEKKGPYRLVGTIGFTGGRLSWISKDWGSFEGEGTLKFYEGTLLSAK
jgi:uncharacterized protein (DUF433 family)